MQNKTHIPLCFLFKKILVKQSFSQNVEDGLTFLRARHCGVWTKGCPTSTCRQDSLKARLNIALKSFVLQPKACTESLFYLDVFLLENDFVGQKKTHSVFFIQFLFVFFFNGSKSKHKQTALLKSLNSVWVLTLTSVKAGWHSEPFIGRSETGAQESPLVALCCDLAAVQMPQHSCRISRLKFSYTSIWIAVSCMRTVDLCSLALWEAMKQN